MTPSHDEYGNAILADKEYHHLHGLSAEEFAKLPAETKQLYNLTNSYHFRRRQEIDVDSIVTGDGTSYRDKLEYYKRVRSQKPQ